MVLGSVAQWTERFQAKVEVTGSNPVGTAITYFDAPFVSKGDGTVKSFLMLTPTLNSNSMLP